MRYREHASAARALAVRRFSLDGFVRSYLALYDEALAAAAARRALSA